MSNKKPTLSIDKDGQKRLKTKATKKYFSNNFYLVSIAISVIIVAITLGHYPQLMFWWNISTSELKYVDDHSTWAIDDAFYQHVKNITCDFTIIDIKDVKMSHLENYMQNNPVVIRGLTDKWPAFLRWTRRNLTELYGSKIIQSGSESSIVYAGGTAGIPITLGKMLSEMRRGNNYSDIFAFDVSVLKAIPQLRNDFTIPKPFQGWDTIDNENEGKVWHMLSLASSRNGLPFHSHGETWIAVVHGMKRWLIYPPAYSLPQNLLPKNPLERVYDWYVDNYNDLQKFPPIHLDEIQSITFDRNVESLEEVMKNNHSILPNDSNHNFTKFKPLECVQQAGDVFFLPAGWNHMTMNIGETIGIGGQAALLAPHRLSMAMKILETNGNDFDALKGAALALAHIALEEESRVRSQLMLTKAGLAQLKKDNFLSLVHGGEDTWIVQFFSRTMPNGDEYASTWNSLASRLKGLVSVGAIDVTNISDNDLQTQFDVNKYDVESQSVIKLYPGGERNKMILQCMYDRLHGKINDKESSLSEYEVIKLKGITYGGERKLQELSDYALDVLMKPEWKLGHGSISTLGVKARRLLVQAQTYLRQAISAQPLHPEARGLYGEILGYAGDYDAMKRAILEAEELYDRIDSSKVSKHSLAAIYHKLGTTFLTQKFGEWSLPLFEKSLKIQSNFVPSLVDRVIAHIMANDIDNAKITFEKLESTVPGHPALETIRKTLYGSGKAKNHPKMKNGPYIPRNHKLSKDQPR